MTKYYVYTQQWCDTSIANCYDAYTDNEFLMKEYLDQIDLCLKNSGYISPAIRNDILEIESKSEEHLIDLLDNMEIGNFMSKENKLWAIDNDFTKSRVIINDKIYDKFIETFIVTDEIAKINHNLYRLSRPQAMIYLNKYLNEDISKNVLLYIKILSDARKNFTFKSNAPGTYGMITKNRFTSGIWDTISECYEVSRFIEMDILKIIKFWG